MRYALIMAGGSGTRLWPMSTAQLPKQLIPFIGGRSLLQIAMERLRGLLPDEQIFVCAGEHTRDVMLQRLPGLTADRFIGEPVGRDTLPAVGLAAACIRNLDPDATIAVFTADHIIEPVDAFQALVTDAFDLAESSPRTLVTFGIEPTEAATGYGYLELGEGLNGGARRVARFREKPDPQNAEAFFEAGPTRYLWNSGMFVWTAQAVLEGIDRFAPDHAPVLQELGQLWGTDRFEEQIQQVYPELEKISVDFALMEPASTDSDFTVAAVPMPLKWLDVGSWPSFQDTLERCPQGNSASCDQAIQLNSRNTLIASDQQEHVVATLGCDDLIVIHTAHATLVCHKDHAQDIKQLQAAVAERFGAAYV